MCLLLEFINFIFVVLNEMQRYEFFLVWANCFFGVFGCIFFVMSK